MARSNVVIIQRAIRRYLYRKRYLAMESHVISLQRRFRGRRERRRQRHFPNMHFSMSSFMNSVMMTIEQSRVVLITPALLYAIWCVQRLFRRRCKRMRALKEEESARQLQSIARMLRGMRKSNELRHHYSVIRRFVLWCHCHRPAQSYQAAFRIVHDDIVPRAYQQHLQFTRLRSLQAHIRGHVCRRWYTMRRPLMLVQQFINFTALLSIRPLLYYPLEYRPFQYPKKLCFQAYYTFEPSSSSGKIELWCCLADHRRYLSDLRLMNHRVAQSGVLVQLVLRSRVLVLGSANKAFWWIPGSISRFTIPYRLRRPSEECLVSVQCFVLGTYYCDSTFKIMTDPSECAPSSSSSSASSVSASASTSSSSSATFRSASTNTVYTKNEVDSVALLLDQDMPHVPLEKALLSQGFGICRFHSYYSGLIHVQDFLQNFVSELSGGKPWKRVFVLNRLPYELLEVDSLKESGLRFQMLTFLFRGGQSLGLQSFLDLCVQALPSSAYLFALPFGGSRLGLPKSVNPPPYTLQLLLLTPPDQDALDTLAKHLQIRTVVVTNSSLSEIAPSLAGSALCHVGSKQGSAGMLFRVSRASGAPDEHEAFSRDGSSRGVFRFSTDLQASYSLATDRPTSTVFSFAFPPKTGRRVSIGGRSPLLQRLWGTQQKARPSTRE